jgi:predicted permease
MFNELRIAVRGLRKQPAFTAVAVLTLGLGIAATTTVFSWIDSILLNPIPGIPNSAQVAVLEGVAPDGEHVITAHPDFRDYQRQLTLVSGVFASHFMPFTIGREADAQRVFGEAVSANYFAVLGVRPELGRVFLPAEDRDDRGAFPLAVISDRLWRSRFHGNPGAVGQVERINGHQLTIVGVVPPEFQGTMGGLSLNVWVPLSQVEEMGGVGEWTAGDRAAKCYDLKVRLKPGVSIGRARSEVQAVAARLAAIYPTTHRGFSATLLPVWQSQSGAQSLLLSPLRILMAVSFVVLLIACANVANLLLARSVSRQREFGIRIAMGASRARLVRQLLGEALLLAGGGALVGVLLSPWMADSLGYLFPTTDLPIAALLEPLGNRLLNPTVLAFAVLVCFLTAILSAIVPALYSSRIPVNETLKESGRGGMSGARSHRARALLVVLEVALATVALIGAGLFLRSFRNVRNISPGFDPHNVLIARLYLSYSGYSREQEQSFDRALRLRLEQAPGVQRVSYADWVPLWFGNAPWSGVRVDGYTRDGEADPRVSRTLVAPGYFDLMRIPLLAGRDFTEQDDSKSAAVIVVNQAFARRFFEGRDPVGRKLRVNGEPRTIVGMARDSKQNSPAEAPSPYFYEPFAQRFGTGNNNFIYIRTAGDPAAVRATLRHEIAALDPSAGIYDASPMEDYTSASLFPQKVAAMLLTALGLLSLVLAALGLYSVMAYSVNERTHEIGIRMALGSPRGSVLAMIVRKAMNMTAVGLAAGIACALALAHVVGSLLVEVSAADPLTFLFAILFLTAVALAASYIPAQRATRIDPMNALRCD